jgi:hypothetical protein
VAGVAGRYRDDLAARLVRLGEYLPGLFQEYPAGLGQGDVALAALHQAHAKFRFQRLDLLRQGWLRKMKAQGCPSETQLLGDGHEIA